MSTAWMYIQCMNIHRFSLTTAKYFNKLHKYNKQYSYVGVAHYSLMLTPYARFWWRELSSPAPVELRRACACKIWGENAPSYNYKPAMCHQEQTEGKEVTRQDLQKDMEVMESGWLFKPVELMATSIDEDRERIIETVVVQWGHVPTVYLAFCGSWKWACCPDWF